MSVVLSTLHDSELEAAGAALVRGLGGFWQGSTGMCRCPAHDDRTPSLSVRVGDTRLLFKCFAGCDTRDVLRAIRRLDPNALGAKGNGIAKQFKLDRWLQKRAFDLWRVGRPINWTIAETYLRNRSIHIALDSLPLLVYRFVGHDPCFFVNQVRNCSFYV